MAIQLYGTVASRNLIEAEMKLLKHAEPYLVLTMFGDQKDQPLNKTDTRVFRRLKPFNATSAEVPNITAANFVTQEGTTPTANTISYTDVTVTLQQYAVLFKFSSKAELTYEDDIPDDMATLTGETLAEVAELVCYGVMKAGTTVIYTNGSARNTLASTISLNKLRSAARTLESNRGKKVTKKVAPGPNYGTAGVEPAFVVFCHTDMMADIRDVTGFVDLVHYGTAVKPVHPREFGKAEEFRFVSSSLLAPILAGGANDSNAYLSAGAANYDVYPLIVIAESAMGHVSLKGKGLKTGISPTIIPSSVKNHANPSGMFGYVGADFWYAAVRLNDNWMARIETCASEL
jgi:N4-gp56 family major capsid protein